MPPLTRKNPLAQQSLQLPVKPVLAQPPVGPAVPQLLLPPLFPQQPQHLSRNSAPCCQRRRLKRCNRPSSGTRPSFRPRRRNGTCRRFKGSTASSRRRRHRVRHAVRSTRTRSSRTPPPPPPPHRAPATRPDKQSRVHAQTL